MTEQSLPTSPDSTNWGIYGDSAREQWNGIYFEAEVEDHEREVESEAEEWWDKEERFSYDPLPTKLHIIRCLTDVAKEHPNEAVRIFSILFLIMALDPILPYNNARSLLFEIGIDIHRLQWMLPTSSYDAVAMYIDNYRTKLDIQEAKD